MTGRDTHELHRASTPLEALFDLTTVVAVAAAATRLHHGLREARGPAYVLPVLLASFAAVASVASGLSLAWGLLLLATGPALLIGWVTRDRGRWPERFAVR